MNARTKIVATLGPAMRPAACARRHAAGRRRRRPSQPQPRPSRRTHRQAPSGSRGSRRGPGCVVAVLADLPGPKVRAAPFADGGVRAGRRVDGHAGHRRRDAVPATVIGVDYDTLLADLHTRRPHRDRRRCHHACASSGSRPAGAECQVRSGGRTRGRPGCTFRRNGCESSRRRPKTSCLAAAMAAEGVDFLAVSFVRDADDIDQGARRHRTAVDPAGRQDRDAVGDRASRRDHRCVRRGDGCPRRPRHRVPTRRRAAHAEADRSDLRRGRSAGHHRDPDDGEHDHRAVADARRGQRCRQRGLRRHGCVDAVGGDRDRRRSCQRGQDDGAGRRASRAGRELCAVGRPPRPAAADELPGGSRPDHDGHHARRGAWPRRMPVPRRSCAARAPGRTALAMARFRPTARLIGLSPDPSTVRALALSWGVTSLQVVDVHDHR